MTEILLTTKQESVAAYRLQKVFHDHRYQKRPLFIIAGEADMQSTTDAYDMIQYFQCIGKIKEGKYTYYGLDVVPTQVGTAICEDCIIRTPGSTGCVIYDAATGSQTAHK